MENNFPEENFCERAIVVDVQATSHFQGQQRGFVDIVWPISRKRKSDELVDVVGGRWKGRVDM